MDLRSAQNCLSSSHVLSTESHIDRASLPLRHEVKNTVARASTDGDVDYAIPHEVEEISAVEREGAILLSNEEGFQMIADTREMKADVRSLLEWQAATISELR